MADEPQSAPGSSMGSSTSLSEAEDVQYSCSLLSHGTNCVLLLEELTFPAPDYTLWKVNH